MDNDIEVVKDSDEVSVIIKTADQTRKADITVPKDSACSEIISGAIENFRPRALYATTPSLRGVAARAFAPR